MTFLRWARIHWDRVTAWVLIGLGGLFIVLGWVRIGREVLTAQQIPYIISGGIGGLALIGVGAMLYLSADLRDEWRKLDAIHRDARAAASAPVPDDDDPFRPPDESSAASNGVAPIQRRPITARTE